MPKMIRAWWCVSSNFGDAINPYVIALGTDSQATDIVYEDANSPRRKIIACGSVLQHGQNGVLIGAGAASPNVCPGAGAMVYATRGKITKKLCENFGYQVSTTGDPAVLLQDFVIKTSQMNSRRIAILPHYVDQQFFNNTDDLTSRDAEFINILLPDVTEWLTYLSGFTLIVTSSLHGLICGAILDIPVVWVWFEGSRIIGGLFKYHDFLTNFDPPVMQQPLKINSTQFSWYLEHPEELWKNSFRLDQIVVLDMKKRLKEQFMRAKDLVVD